MLRWVEFLTPAILSSSVRIQCSDKLGTFFLFFFKYVYLYINIYINHWRSIQWTSPRRSFLILILLFYIEQRQWNQTKLNFFWLKIKRLLMLRDKYIYIFTVWLQFLKNWRKGYLLIMNSTHFKILDCQSRWSPYPIQTAIGGSGPCQIQLPGPVGHWTLLEQGRIGHFDTPSGWQLVRGQDCQQEGHLPVLLRGGLFYN